MELRIHRVGLENKKPVSGSKEQRSVLDIAVWETDIVIWIMMEARLESKLSNSTLGVVDPGTLFNFV